MIREPEKLIMGMPVKDFVFKFLKMFFLLLFVFYYVYPQALGIMGRSFIVPSAVLGLGVYAWNRFPFEEVAKVLFMFFCLLLWCFICEYINGIYHEGFKMMYTRSQMGWFFTAYLVNLVLFNIHKNPRFEVIVGYLAGAVILQCIITFIMNQNEAANDFFYSIQLSDGTDFDRETRELIEEQRLVGYGTGLFGAGMVAGYALILIIYLITKLKLNLFQLLRLAVS